MSATTMRDPLTIRGGQPTAAHDNNSRAVPSANGRTLDRYFIWSHMHNAWWRANNQGYTNDLLQAGIYTYDESVKIVRTRTGEVKEEAILVLDRADELKRVKSRIDELLTCVDLDNDGLVSCHVSRAANKNEVARWPQ